MDSKKKIDLIHAAKNELEQKLSEKVIENSHHLLLKKSSVLSDVVTNIQPVSAGKSQAELKELARLSHFNQLNVSSDKPRLQGDQKHHLTQPYGPSRAKNDKKMPASVSDLVNALTLSGLHFVCQIDSLGADALAVTEFTQEEGLSQLFTLTVTAVSNNANIDIKSLLLNTADFYVFVDGVPQRKISGVVASAKKGKTGAHRTFYTFTIKPHLWMLTLRKDSRIFHFKTVPQILESLLAQHNAPYDFKLFETHSVREYTTQKRESDYELFCRLAAEEGISHWVECDVDGNPQVFFSDSRLGCTAGVELTYNPHPQSATTDKLLSNVDISATMMPGKVIAKDYNYHKPQYQLMHEAATADEVAAQDRFTVFDSFGRFQTDAEGKPFTQYRLDAIRAESELGTADGCCIQVRPGQQFTLSSHPDASLNAAWQPVRVNHSGFLPQSMEEETDKTGAYLTTHIEFVSSQTQWRPPFIPKPTVDGPEVAVVVGPKGEEIFTNENGEIKIHFHWNRYDPADERASCWVRVVQSWMGDDWGFVSIPRIGQEVVVTYLDGDIDRPVVSGGVYNAQNRPPLNLPAEKTRTSFKSKTHKGDGFNEIRFEDAGGQQDFFMHAQKDMNTTVQNDRNTIVLANHSENVVQNQAVNIGLNQVMNVGANQMVNVVENQNVTILSKHALSVKSDQNVVVGGNKSELAEGAIIIASATGIRLACGDTAIQLDNAGNINLICKNFNFYATEDGQISTGKVLDLNMEGASPGTEAGPVADDIKDIVESLFSAGGK